MSLTTSKVQERRYVADETGTRYDVFETLPREPHWTVVVCEDRPALYRPLLRRLVQEGLASTALTVPFQMDSVSLLRNGMAMLGGQTVTIRNPDQCILVLDMDGDPTGCDLPGIDAGRRAYIGAEFFRLLPRKIQEKTLLASRFAPFKVNSDYLRDYPELHCVLTHADFVEKQTDAAQPQLTEDAEAWIIGVIKNLQRRTGGPTFAPSTEEVFAAKDRPKGKRVVLRTSFDGSVAFSPIANNAARYVFNCLCYPHKLLDTAKMVEAVGGLPIDEREATEPDDWQTSARRSDETTTLGADKQARNNYRYALQRKLDELINAFRKKEKPVGNDSPIGRPGFLVQWGKSDDSGEVAAITKALRDSGYKIGFRYVDGGWKVTIENRTMSLRRQPDGAIQTLAASRSVRKAIDRWLKSEIAPRHAAMFQHLWVNIQRSDDSATIHYSGGRNWELGPANHTWRIPLKQVEAQ